MRTKILLISLLLCSASAFASEIGDTIILKSGKSVIINEDSSQVNVSVIEENGKMLNQTYEKSFSDEREVEYYISSPFFPQSKEIRKNIKKRSIVDMSPDIFIGTSELHGNAPFGKDIDFARNSKSWEIGLTLASFTGPICREIGLGFSGSIQLINVHHHFDRHHILTSNPEGVVSLVPSDETLKKSYLSYWAIHIPFMAETQQLWGHTRVNLAVGPYLEWRFSESSRYYIDKSKYTATHDVNLNPIGYGLEARIGLSGFQIYCRAALSSLIKTKNPNWVDGIYPITIGFGLN